MRARCGSRMLGGLAVVALHLWLSCATAYAQSAPPPPPPPDDPRWHTYVPGPSYPGGPSPPPPPLLDVQQRPLPGMEGSSGDGGDSVGMGKGRLEPMPDVDAQ